MISISPLLLTTFQTSRISLGQINFGSRQSGTGKKGLISAYKKILKPIHFFVLECQRQEGSRCDFSYRPCPPIIVHTYNCQFQLSTVWIIIFYISETVHSNYLKRGLKRELKGLHKVPWSYCTNYSSIIINVDSKMKNLKYQNHTQKGQNLSFPVSSLIHWITQSSWSQRSIFMNPVLAASIADTILASAHC